VPNHFEEKGNAYFLAGECKIGEEKTKDTNLCEI
jgi:hypothetical protein